MLYFQLPKKLTSEKEWKLDKNLGLCYLLDIVNVHNDGQQDYVFPSIPCRQMDSNESTYQYSKVEIKNSHSEEDIPKLRAVENLDDNRETGEINVFDHS